MKHTPVFSCSLIRWIVAVAVLSLRQAAFAQAVAHGTIEGRVLNARSGEYLEGARVTVDGTALVAFTESDGTYRLSQVPVGPARLTVFYTGLPPQAGRGGHGRPQQQL